VTTTASDVLDKARAIARRYRGWFTARTVAGGLPVELAERVLLASEEFEAAFVTGDRCRPGRMRVVAVFTDDPLSGPPARYLCPTCRRAHRMRDPTLAFRAAPGARRAIQAP
jgi:hypothetical protein